MEIRANPVKITEEQIREYDEKGYVIIPGVYSEEACDAIKKAAMEVAPADYAVYLNIHRNVPLFLQIARDPVVVALVKAVQRHRVMLTNDQFLYKVAGTPYAKQSWSPHQDNAYLKAPREAYMQFHIFLDRSEKENGGLYYYPGSHFEDILPYEYVQSWREKIDADGISRPGWKVETPPKYQRVDAVGPKGAICMQHGHVIHGSYPNLTADRSRCQYSMAFLNEGVPFSPGKGSVKIPVAVE